MKKRKGILLGTIQTIVAVGGITAGLSMIFQPDGQGIGISTDILLGSPFKDFLIPGLFLFFINGLFQGFGAILSFRRHRYTKTLGLTLGIILVLWICVQVYFISLTHFLQPTFFFIGIIEIVLSLLQPKIR
ncbi:hypothetical protein EZS27_006124 [termite gut metagenome]|uniref:DUF4064 domain-containing protein n=1 Tax=termite gut metagenome TaxID=433724 RepID=A0A5J4SJQ1_9ZZZZ